jgi:hypothetical protein
MFTKTNNFDYNKRMIWMRKGLVHVLSLVLFVTLLGGALVTSADVNLRQPAKIESWLNQSQLYDHFVSDIIAQAQKSTGGNDQPGSVSLSDSVVQQAARSAFPPGLVQQDVNSFLDSNYAWLQGKTSKPNFVINLTQAKQSFAQQVGQYVQVYTASLPVCTAAQEAGAQDVDPLAASCRPAALTPQAVGSAATQQLASSSNFLSNPVITASSIDPRSNVASSNTPSQAYYQKLSRAPQLYRLATKLPLILGGVGVLSVLGIIFIAPRKRKGLRRVGILFLETGAILVVIKFVADFVFHKLESKVFNDSSVGQLQQSLTSFAQRVEMSLVKTDLLFGITYLVFALVIFGALYRTRQPKATAIAPLSPKAAIDSQAQVAAARPLMSRLRTGRKQPPGSNTTAPTKTSISSQPTLETLQRFKKKLPPPRPPRLIQ